MAHSHTTHSSIFGRSLWWPNCIKRIFELLCPDSKLFLCQFTAPRSLMTSIAIAPKAKDCGWKAASTHKPLKNYDWFNASVTAALIATELCFNIKINFYVYIHKIVLGLLLLNKFHKDGNILFLFLFCLPISPIFANELKIQKAFSDCLLDK